MDRQACPHGIRFECVTRPNPKALYMDSKLGSFCDVRHFVTRKNGVSELGGVVAVLAWKFILDIQRQRFQRERKHRRI